MKKTKKNQCIVVSGESGAGKVRQDLDRLLGGGMAAAFFGRVVTWQG